MSVKASFSRPVSRWLLAASLLASLTVLPGCISGRIGGSTELDQVIDELRQDNLALRRQVTELEQTLADRQAYIEVLNQQLKGSQPVEGAQVPKAVGIEFDRFSGVVDTNGDQAADVLRVYVRPRDQKGRFLPVAGAASVQVVSIRSGQDPLTIASANYSAQQWEEAYRSGVTGTHYTLELPLPEKMPKGVRDLTVLVVLTDGATGAELSHQAVMSLR